MSPIVVDPPRAAAAPLVVAVPHAGTLLTPDLVARLRLSPDRLRVLEDPWVDRLFAGAAELGAWRLSTRWARAVADVNRAPDEFAFTGAAPGFRATAKARVGLGVVPTAVAGQPIYAAPLTVPDVEARVALAHRPYHEALRRLLDHVLGRFERVLVLDCHSMPGHSLPDGPPRVDVVLGDRFGTAACSEVTRAVDDAFGGHGFRVTRNRPFAGGYVTQHYGAPAGRIDVVQVELRRDLYMIEETYAASAGFDTVRARLERAMIDIVAWLGQSSTPSLAGCGD